MKMLYWRVLIKPIAAERTTKGGIVLPDEVVSANQQLTQTGEIIDMGPLAFTARTSLGYDYAAMDPKPKVGDMVVFPKYGARDIKLRDGEVVKIVEDFEILAIADTEQEVVSYV